MIKFSILQNDKAVKYSKMIIVDRFDSENHKMITLEKPDTTIVNMTMIDGYIRAMQSDMDRKAVKLEKQLIDVNKQMDKTLSSQSKVLDVMNELLSDEFKKENGGIK